MYRDHAGVLAHSRRIKGVHGGRQAGKSHTSHTSAPERPVDPRGPLLTPIGYSDPMDPSGPHEAA